MNIELPSLDSEAILYILQQRSGIVGGISVLFFILGVGIGAVLWGRYKKQLALARQEMDGQRAELTQVKQRLKELPAYPAAIPLTGPAPIPAPVEDAKVSVAPAAAESVTIPPERAVLPELAQATVSTAPSCLEPLPELVVSSLPALPEVETNAPASEVTRWEFPEVEATPPTDSATPPPLPALQQGEFSPPRRPIILAHRHKSPVSVPAVAALPALELPAVSPEPASDIEAFGFLLGEDDQENEPNVSLSTLAAIVQGHVPAPELPKPLPRVDAPTLSGLGTNLPTAIGPGVPPLPEPADMPSSIEPILPVAIEFDRDLGLIYRKSPPVVDDLTQIRGVSGALAVRLNELGVYTFRQIAAWDENQLREFSQRLAFKDRITREQWIQQARSLNEARNQILDLVDQPQPHLSDGAS